MVADRVRGKALSRATPRRKTRQGVAISEEQRKHLVEACAFFRARQYRDAAPYQVREADVRDAEAVIDAVIAPHAGRRQKRGS